MSNTCHDYDKQSMPTDLSIPTIPAHLLMRAQADLSLKISWSSGPLPFTTALVPGLMHFKK